MAKTVRDVMTSEPATVEPSDSIVDAAKKMKSEDTGALLVTEEDELKGIVTDRDIVLGAVAEDKNPSKVKVEEVCSTDATTVEADADIDEAIEKMRESKVRRLPVVEDGEPVGIVSLGDLAVERDESSVLADISEASPND